MAQRRQHHWHKISSLSWSKHGNLNATSYVLYVCWAHQLRRNFNLDSIATLLSLSRQCGYIPIDFLHNVKTLSVHKNQKSAYGVTFHFDIPNRKDLDQERLNKEFLGLSVMLSLLQEQVTDSPSILGKTGMRQSSPRKAYPIDIPVTGDKKRHASVVTHPNVEFHTQSSLLNRIWISINHRWLVFFWRNTYFEQIYLRGRIRMHLFILSKWWHLVDLDAMNSYHP